jgi:hypothetical protein
MSPQPVSPPGIFSQDLPLMDELIEDTSIRDFTAIE